MFRFWVNSPENGGGGSAMKDWLAILLYKTNIKIGSQPLTTFIYLLERLSSLEPVTTLILSIHILYLPIFSLRKCCNFVSLFTGLPRAARAYPGGGGC